MCLIRVLTSPSWIQPIYMHWTMVRFLLKHHHMPGLMLITCLSVTQSSQSSRSVHPTDDQLEAAAAIWNAKSLQRECGKKLKGENCLCIPGRMHILLLLLLLEQLSKVQSPEVETQVFFVKYPRNSKWPGIFHLFLPSNAFLRASFLCFVNLQIIPFFAQKMHH